MQKRNTNTIKASTAHFRHIGKNSQTRAIGDKHIQLLKNIFQTIFFQGMEQLCELQTENNKEKASIVWIPALSRSWSGWVEQCVLFWTGVQNSNTAWTLCMK